MSILDHFRNILPTGNAPAGAAANPTVPNNTTKGSDGSVVAIPAAPTDANKSPLEGFAKLWEIKTDDKGTVAPSLVPKMNMDPAKLREHVSKIDFLSGINPELLQKAMAGNDPQSLLQVVNSAVQAAFQQGVTTSAQMMEAGFGAQANTLLTHTLPTSMADYATKNAVVNSNAVMNNPAVAPLVDMVRKQFQGANPAASPVEIQTAVSTYFDAMSQEVLKASGYQVQAQQTGNNVNGLQPRQVQDWSTWVPASGIG